MLLTLWCNKALKYINACIWTHYPQFHKRIFTKENNARKLTQVVCYTMTFIKAQKSGGNALHRCIQKTSELQKENVIKGCKGALYVSAQNKNASIHRAWYNRELTSIIKEMKFLQECVLQIFIFIVIFLLTWIYLERFGFKAHHYCRDITIIIFSVLVKDLEWLYDYFLKCT